MSRREALLALFTVFFAVNAIVFAVIAWRRLLRDVNPWPPAVAAASFCAVAWLMVALG